VHTVDWGARVGCVFVRRMPGPSAFACASNFIGREIPPSPVGNVADKCSPAMWSIFQIQDLLGMDGQLRHQDAGAERINVPANPKNYWRYRMHMTLEALLNSHEFTNRIRRLVQQSGR